VTLILEFVLSGVILVHFIKVVNSRHPTIPNLAVEGITFPEARPVFTG
jgi:hypothetical protein